MAEELEKLLEESIESNMIQQDLNCFMELVGLREAQRKVLERIGKALPSPPEDRLLGRIPPLLASSSGVLEEAEQDLRSKLKKADEHRVLEELVRRELVRVERYMHMNPGHDCVDRMNFLLSFLLESWSTLVETGVVRADSDHAKVLGLLGTSDIYQLSDYNPFLRYLTRVQSAVSPLDIMKLITDKTVGINPEVVRGPTIMDRVHSDLYDFMSELGLELKKKFKLFSTKSSRSGKLIKVCDFMTFLKTIFQDTSSVCLMTNGPEKRTSIFQSVQYGKKIFREIYSYFYNRLKIDPRIPGNDVNSLRIDFGLFLQLLSHLIESNVIVWISDQDTKQEEPEPPKPALPAVEEGFALDLSPITDLDLQNKIGKLLNNDTSISFKVFNAIKEFRLAHDLTSLPLEKDICKNLLTSLNTQLMRLQIFKKKFDNKEANFAILKKHNKKLETIFFTLTTSPSLPMKPPTRPLFLDSEKYSLMLEMLGFPELLPHFNRKSFSILYMVQIKNSSSQLDFKGFLALFEMLVNKVTERNSETAFEATLQLVFSNFDRNYQALTIPGKRPLPGVFAPSPKNNKNQNSSLSYYVGIADAQSPKHHLLKTRKTTPDREGQRLPELTSLSRDGPALNPKQLARQNTIIVQPPEKSYKGYLNSGGNPQKKLQYGSSRFHHTRSVSKLVGQEMRSSGQSPTHTPVFVAHRQRKSSHHLDGIMTITRGQAQPSPAPPQPGPKNLFAKK